MDSNGLVHDDIGILPSQREDILGRLKEGYSLDTILAGHFPDLTLGLVFDREDSRLADAYFSVEAAREGQYPGQMTFLRYKGSHRYHVIPTTLQQLEAGNIPGVGMRTPESKKDVYDTLARQVRSNGWH